jgi:predicted DNA binding CopG/RHH family protein
MRDEYDFSNAKRANQVPHLAQLQAEQAGKSSITMPVDNETLAIFKARAELTGANYQALMNEALKQYAQGLTLSDMIRETIQQELHHV